MSHTIDQPFDLLLDAANDALWLWDRTTDQARWGAAWRTLTGLPENAGLLPGAEEWHARLHPDERAQVLHLLEQHLAGESSLFEAEHRLRTEDGSYRWVLARARCQLDAAGKPALLAGSFTDISEHKVLDPYTRLPNRILLLDRLERSLSRRRFGGSHAVGVLSIQIHLPASHADLLSHDEQVLMARILCERITSELRPWDFVAQFDALEYAALLEMVASGTDIPTITDRLLGSLRQPVVIGQHTLQIGASIGSADTVSVSGDEEHMLRAAESAGKLAASHGNYRYVAYDADIQEQLSHHLQIEQDIVAALVEQTFEPWFQPIVRLSDGAIAGFEALARWPRHGEILEPRQFLPFMERGGLVNQLTWIMLQKGLEAHEQWIEDGLIPPESLLSVNLPADQLLDPQLVEQIYALIEDIDISAQRIRFEIQEKNVLRPNPLIHESLAHLRRHGANIAIDDTGAGQSSLLQLQRFPVDTLKIERSLVRELENSAPARGVIRSIVALAGTMNLTVIAKGVETTGQLAFLREQGVDQAQGFLFAPALREADVPVWLASRKTTG